MKHNEKVAWKEYFRDHAKWEKEARKSVTAGETPPPPPTPPGGDTPPPPPKP